MSIRPSLFETKWANHKESSNPINRPPSRSQQFDWPRVSKLQPRTIRSTSIPESKSRGLDYKLRIFLSTSISTTTTQAYWNEEWQFKNRRNTHSWCKYVQNIKPIRIRSKVNASFCWTIKQDLKSSIIDLDFQGSSHWPPFLIRINPYLASLDRIDHMLLSPSYSIILIDLRGFGFDSTIDQKLKIPFRMSRVDPSDKLVSNGILHAIFNLANLAETMIASRSNPSLCFNVSFSSWRWLTFSRRLVIWSWSFSISTSFFFWATIISDLRTSITSFAFFSAPLIEPRTHPSFWSPC